MPLFNRNSQTVTQPVVEEPRRSNTLFGRKDRDVADVNTTRNSRSTFNDTNNTESHKTGFLHRHHEDASIVAARERVATAEAMEREADKALIQARAAVKEAREHIRRLEKEAAEEARLAKIKQQQAANISKRGSGLGRHSRT